VNDISPKPNEAVVFDAGQRTWLWFRKPLRVLVAERLDQVPSLLHEVDSAVKEDRVFAAGYLAYEAAPALDSALVTLECKDFPVAWFALYGRPQPVSWPPMRTRREAPNLPWRPSLSAEAYAAALERIRSYIRDGDTYQINYTYRLAAACELDPFSLWVSLIEAQRTGYGAFINTERWSLCSASPELFLARSGERLISRPMKGTAPRGLTTGDDEAQATWLSGSEKNRAENLIIVDMVRNDLGRIATFGSVSVPELYSIERYPTVWQMTSSVEASSPAGLLDTLRATFPAASITGAPKARAMEIIAELETQPRRIYTGTMGFVSPDDRAQFNVAIRTVLVDKQRRIAEYGTGGGIVWDSEPEKEYQESLTKARILHHAQPNFSLLETMLWRPDSGILLLDRHLTRVAESARYFGFTLDVSALRARLREYTEGFEPAAHRIRVLIAKDGSATLEAGPLAGSDPTRVLSVCLARTPVDRNDTFLYHKTTRREVYENALAAHPGFDDVVLWNQDGEVTESCLANVVVELEGGLYTPPVGSGLLAGTYRGWLLDQGRVTERLISVADLRRCSRVLLVNSVRGEQTVKLDLSLATREG
jgi:para-aminobenzoate synthetase/4-amino-4-deoxychorismate lyase